MTELFDLKSSQNTLKGTFSQYIFLVNFSISKTHSTIVRAKQKRTPNTSTPNLLHIDRTCVDFKALEQNSESDNMRQDTVGQLHPQSEKRGRVWNASSLLH